MYQSRAGVERKLVQARYLFVQLKKYKGKIIVKNGIDPATGSYPLLALLSSFLSMCGSVLQYAHKEAKARSLTNAYESFVGKRKILAFFKELRNMDVHEYTIGAHTIIELAVEIQRADEDGSNPSRISASAKDEEISGMVAAGTKRPQMETRLSKRVIVTTELLTELQRAGKYDLVKAAQDGKELYEEVEFEGEKDLFNLCESYLTVLEEFVEFGKKNGLVS